MVLNAAAQALRQAVDLKTKILQGSETSVPTTNRTLSLTQLQKAYQKVLLVDLDYALDKKVEQDLWNVGFKNQIELLQNNAKDKKNPHRAENQTLLLWVLQAATGFYICLLHQICTTFKLNLPFRCNIPYPWGDVPYTVFRPPQPASCWYICQHCLVHLGDLARYSRQPRRADSFYRQALTVSPRNGQPYNQLGLLRAARGDRIGAAYYHARGLAVGGPFPPAANNLARTLLASKHVHDGSLSPSARLSIHSYTGGYMAVHHRLQTAEGLDEAKALLPTLSSTLTALVATDEFSADTIIKMCCLDLYAVFSTTDGHKLPENAMTEDEQQALAIALDLVAGTLAALLLPAHTRAQEEMLTYPALPAVKVLLEWLKIHPEALKGPAFVSRLQLWPGLCVLLNSLQNSIKDFSGLEYEVVPLPEDEELQGYLPIDLAFSKLQFVNSASIGNAEQILATSEDLEGTPIREMLVKIKENGQLSHSDIEVLKKDPCFIDSLRAYRLIGLGEWLANHQKENGVEYISISEMGGAKVFSPAHSSPEASQELHQAIAELAQLREKRLSECLELESQLSETISTTSQRDEDNLSDAEGKPAQLGLARGGADEEMSILITDVDVKEKVREKRAGILKPQGSLERARVEKAALVLVETLTPDSASLSAADLSVTPDGADHQDTASSCSTVSQDGNICTDVGSLLDPPLSREGTETKGRRGRTNVAMQAIMRKQEESSKQVKFLTPVTTPDSIGEPSQLSPLSSKDMEKKTILQPKVIKSLASIPTDRKTGGILSLKDKSAGYPHLVHIETAEIKSDVSTSSGDDTQNPKDKQLNMASQHAEFGKHLPGKNNVAEVSQKDDGNGAPSTGYVSWSDGTSVTPSRSNFSDGVQKDNRFLNSGAQSKQNFSYFSDAQNSSNITLPVVNPKEIDVRSVALQRQKSIASNESDQYNKDNMPQYNYWYGSPSNPNQHSPAQRESGRNVSLPPRLANLKKNKNVPEHNPRMQQEQAYRYQEGSNAGPMTSPGQAAPAWNTNSQQPQTTWWKPSNHEANYDSMYQPQNLSRPNQNQNYSSYYGTSPQNTTGHDFPDQANYNYNQPNAMHGRNQNLPQKFPEPSQTSPRYNAAYQAPNAAYPAAQNYSPYNPYNSGMYPQFSGKFGFPQQPKPPMGNEYCLSPYPNASQFGLAQNMNNLPGDGAVMGQYPVVDVPLGRLGVPRRISGETIKSGFVEITPLKGRKREGNMDAYKQYNPPVESPGSYSLFSGGQEAWGSGAPTGNPMAITPQQSLWSGPGPSPLERLLEQQKHFKYLPNE